MLIEWLCDLTWTTRHPVSLFYASETAQISVAAVYKKPFAVIFRQSSKIVCAHGGVLCAFFDLISTVNWLGVPSQLGLESNAGTSQKLGAMAGWCRKHNVPDDSDPQHFEVASLISRFEGGCSHPLCKFMVFLRVDFRCQRSNKTNSTFMFLSWSWRLQFQRSHGRWEFESVLYPLVIWPF